MRSTRSMVAAAVAATLFHGPAVAQSPPPTGQWQGLAELPAGVLEMRLRLTGSDGDLTGVFEVPSEGVEMPVRSVQSGRDSILVVLSPGRAFRGIVEGDRMSGTLELSDRHAPARFARTGSPDGLELLRRIEALRAEHRAPPLVRTATGPSVDEVDPEALRRLVEGADSAHSHSLVVLRNGALVGAWHAGGQARRIEAMSVTKAVVGLAVGRLWTLGLVESLDTPVHRFYPEWSEGQKARVTLRHLLTHTSGIASGGGTPAIYASGDFVRHALDSPLDAPPGTRFEYGNTAVNLLAGIVGRIAGRPLDEFLSEDLFAALGITDVAWSRDAAGSPHGMSGLQIHAEDLAKLGQLLLNDGVWEGRRLIAAEWVEESTRPGSSLEPRHGLLWWLIRDGEGIVGYRADGSLGQYLVVYPRQRLVGVRMVAASPAYDPGTDEFRDFAERLRTLVP